MRSYFCCTTIMQLRRKARVPNCMCEPFSRTGRLPDSPPRHAAAGAKFLLPYQRRTLVAGMKWVCPPDPCQENFRKPSPLSCPNGSRIPIALPCFKNSSSGRRQTRRRSPSICMAPFQLLRQGGRRRAGRVAILEHRDPLIYDPDVCRGRVGIESTVTRVASNTPTVITDAAVCSYVGSLGAATARIEGCSPTDWNQDFAVEHKPS